jgi:CBS domain-containing protein
MKLKDVMSKRVLTSTPGRTVRQAAREMDRHEVGSLVVREGTRVVGIITERDIVRVVAKGKDPRRLPVGKIMSKPVIVGEESNDLQDAIKIMVLHKIKKLPVLRGKRLVGIVTITDFARVGPLVHDVMQRALVDADAKLKRQAGRMFKPYLPPKTPPSTFYA